MDDVAWLRLQIEWGADEALGDAPQNRVAHSPFASPAVSSRLETTGPALARALAAAAATPEALRHALANFDGCTLRATATNMVFADGDPESKIVLVADTPGPAEDRAGVPFAGSSAEFLDRMLLSAGLDRAHLYAMSVLPWRPPGDRKPAESEVELCLPFLLRHLALLRPRHVVLFGGLAARTLLAAGQRRGRAEWHNLTVPASAHTIPALALASLAHIRATPSAKVAAWTGLLRLRREIDQHHS